MALRRDWLTVTEAAWSLGITQSTIRDAIYHDRILADKVGAQYTIMWDEIERYRREHLGKQGWDKRKNVGYQPSKMAQYKRDQGAKARQQLDMTNDEVI